MKVQYLINPIKTAKETVFKRMTFISKFD